VFRFVDPEQFRTCFISFMARFAEMARHSVTRRYAQGPVVPETRDAVELSG
jgi:hypothetical protein